MTEEKLETPESIEEKSKSDDINKFYSQINKNSIQKLERHTTFLEPLVRFTSNMDNFEQFLSMLETIREYSISGIESPSMPIYINSKELIITALSKLKRATLITYRFKSDFKKHQIATYLKLNNINTDLEQRKADEIILILKVREYLESKGYIVLDGELRLV